jgi:hypothetical protein
MMVDKTKYGYFKAVRGILCLERLLLIANLIYIFMVVESQLRFTPRTNLHSTRSCRIEVAEQSPNLPE